MATMSMEENKLENKQPINPYIYAGLSPSKRMKALQSNLKITNYNELITLFVAVCDAYDQDPQHHMENFSYRKREYVTIRQMFFYVAKKKFKKMALAEFGRFVEKDHATVLHGIRTIENLLQSWEGKEIREYLHIIEHKYQYMKQTKFPINLNQQ